MPTKLPGAVQTLSEGHHREARRRSSSTATAIPRPGIRRPRSAACRTSRPRSTPCRCSARPRSSRCSRSTTCSASARCRAAWTFISSSTCKTVNVESQAGRRDVEDDDFPGRDPLSERVGHDLRQPEGGRLQVRHRHARQGDRNWSRICRTARPRWKRRWSITAAAACWKRHKHYCHKVVPAMLAVRKVADELEGIVADDLWPLPTYQEMLFIKYGGQEK